VISRLFQVAALIVGPFALFQAGSAFSNVPGAAGALSVESGGKTWSLPIQTIEGAGYISLEELQRAIGGSIDRAPSGMELMFRYGGGRFRFIDGIPFFSYEERPYQLIEPPRLYRNHLFLPVQFPTEYLPYLFPNIFTYDGNAHSLRDRRYDSFVRGLRQVIRENETVLFLHASSPPRFDVDSSSPGLLRLDLFQTQCRLALSDSMRAFGHIDSVRVTETTGSTHLLFFLRPDVRRFRVAEVKAPPGISIASSGKDIVDGASLDGRRDLVSGIIDPREFRIQTVVIDPGHGGKDPGAIGKGGRLEKDINLSVALRLKAILQERTDLDIVLTRTDDTYVSLRNRTAMANGENADLFISIHCNASRKRGMQGFEAYFLSAAKTDEERAVALRENLSIKFDEPSVDETSLDDLQFIFWDLAQNEYLRESSDWAGIMCREFEDGSKIRSRGIRQAGFFVLNGAYMPSVLLELGYISNPEEEKLLASRAYQSELAERIYRGIRNYIDRYHRKIGS
jgi:N-acetylmuramoyl-L-alanine amidase